MANTIKLAQSGPGVAGTLVPMTTESKLVLQGETVDITFGETEAVVQAEYALHNPGSQSVYEEVGIPTLSIGDTTFSLIDLTATTGGRALAVTTKEEPLLSSYKYNEFLPLIETFNLKRRWHVMKVDLSAQAQIVVQVRYTLPYLYKSEDLQGRQEQSRKLFRYLRSYGRRWSRAAYRSSLYVRPDKVQEEHITATPRPARVEKSTIIIESQDEGRFTDVTLLYDPIHMRVNAFGFQSVPPPATLENGRNGTYAYKHLFDGDLNTNWCEGEERSGAEKRGFEIEWGKLRHVKEVWVMPGFGGSGMTFQKRNRVKTLNVFLAKPGWTSRPYQLNLKDKPKLQKFALDGSEKASLLVVQLKELTYGSDENTTCLAEILPVFKTD